MLMQNTVTYTLCFIVFLWVIILFYLIVKHSTVTFLVCLLTLLTLSISSEMPNLVSANSTLKRVLLLIMTGVAGLLVCFLALWMATVPFRFLLEVLNLKM